MKKRIKSGLFMFLFMSMGIVFSGECLKSIPVFDESISENHINDEYEDNLEKTSSYLVEEISEAQKASSIQELYNFICYRGT